MSFILKIFILFQDKEKIIDTMVLRPMTTGSPNIDTEPVIFLNNPGPSKDPKEVHIADFDGRPANTAQWSFPDWSLSQKVLFVISSVFIVGLFGFWFFHCIPDCVRSLCEICRRKPHRNRDDAMHFLLSELEENDT